MMKKNRVAAGALIAGLSLTGLSLAACSDPPKTGVVWRTEFNNGHYNSWSLEIRNDDDPEHVKKGWVDVSHRTYHQCPMDAPWPDCASGAR